MNGDVTIITPEHVEIHLVPAGMGRRFIAWFADLLVLLGLMTMVRMGSYVFGTTAGTFLSTTLAFAIWWGYHIVFDLIWQGRTPGKRITGLRVVDDRGLPIGLQQSFVRNVVRILDMQPGIFHGIGALTCMLNPQSRRMGDIAAGTIVVHESKPLTAPRQLTEGWQFNSLRTPSMLRAIRNKLSLEEREFLLTLCLRAATLDDKARFDLTESVGGYYRKKLAIEDEHLSGENIVRGLAAVLFEKQK